MTAQQNKSHRTDFISCKQNCWIEQTKLMLSQPIQEKYITNVIAQFSLQYSRKKVVNETMTISSIIFISNWTQIRGDKEMTQ